METQGNRQTGNHTGKQTDRDVERNPWRHRETDTQGCREKPMDTQGNRYTGM
jgi:hypothetical protein